MTYGVFFLPKQSQKSRSVLLYKGYSIKTYHPGGDPTLKLAKPPLEVQLSVYRPTLEPCSFNTYPPLEEIFISFRMVLVVCIMYVCMYVCTHLFKLTPNMCLLKMSLLKYFYRIFFFFCFFLLFFGAGGGCVRGASWVVCHTNLMIFSWHKEEPDKLLKQIITEKDTFIWESERRKQSQRTFLTNIDLDPWLWP